jgi:hypothetical protein
MTLTPRRLSSRATYAARFGAPVAIATAAIVAVAIPPSDSSADSQFLLKLTAGLIAGFLGVVMSLWYYRDVVHVWLGDKHLDVRGVRGRWTIPAWEIEEVRLRSGNYTDTIEIRLRSPVPGLGSRVRFLVLGSGLVAAELLEVESRWAPPGA